ncbi:hypothetical protein EZ456_04205 [Pedobacter psychrodurus]|uniref:Uncharacterized protein n=1 Tax=Pedobacter psychrodurus TaxID=2530456 RepID=A0A4R0Q4I0_9SPHI|nr:hypothetical protein [Pedobacter psychrodurus]TCD28598.1 hypothetical protein EZ456_04205 [Pedobacter psychrodurus]
MEIQKTNVLLTVHERLYAFTREKSSFYNNYLGKSSPRKLKWARIMLFIFCLIFTMLLILTMADLTSASFYLSSAATVINTVIMLKVFKLTDLERGTQLFSAAFRHQLAVETFVVNQIGLKKREIAGVAAVCLNLSQYYKRNYYRWEIPLGLTSVIVTILCLIKGAGIVELTKVAVVIGLALFALWNAFAKLADLLDRRSERYFGLYLLLEDLQRNPGYRKMRKDYKCSMRAAENGED